MLNFLKNKEIISFLIIGIASVLIDASLYFIFSDYFLLNIKPLLVFFVTKT